MTVVRWFVLALAVLDRGGCCVPAGTPEPRPEIHYGEDMCSDCGMIINDPRFAASYAAEQERRARSRLLSLTILAIC